MQTPDPFIWPEGVQWETHVERSWNLRPTCQTGLVLKDFITAGGNAEQHRAARVEYFTWNTQGNMAAVRRPQPNSSSVPLTPSGNVFMSTCDTCLIRAPSSVDVWHWTDNLLTCWLWPPESELWRFHLPDFNFTALESPRWLTLSSCDTGFASLWWPYRKIHIALLQAGEWAMLVITIIMHQ